MKITAILLLIFSLLTTACSDRTTSTAVDTSHQVAAAMQYGAPNPLRQWNASAYYKYLDYLTLLPANTRLPHLDSGQSAPFFSCFIDSLNNAMLGDTNATAEVRFSAAAELATTVNTTLLLYTTRQADDSTSYSLEIAYATGAVLATQISLTQAVEQFFASMGTDDPRYTSFSAAQQEIRLGLRDVFSNYLEGMADASLYTPACYDVLAVYLTRHGQSVLNRFSGSESDAVLLQLRNLSDSHPQPVIREAAASLLP